MERSQSQKNKEEKGRMVDEVMDVFTRRTNITVKK